MTESEKMMAGEVGTLQTIDEHHEKTVLKVFVVVIPKEGWRRAHPSLGMRPTTEYNLLWHARPTLPK